MEKQHIRFYLRPEKSEPEAVAAQKLDALPDGWKSEFARTGLLSAVALSAINDALPGVLAASLRRSMSREEIARVVVSAIETSLNEQQGKGVDAPVKPAPVVVPEPEPEKAEPNPAAKNLSTLLPD